MFPDAVAEPVAPKLVVALTPEAIPPVPPSRLIAPDPEMIEAPAIQIPQSTPPEPVNCKLPDVEEITDSPSMAIGCATAAANVPVMDTFPEVEEIVDAPWISTLWDELEVVPAPEICMTPDVVEMLDCSYR
jgi:hypothetical protein